MKGVDAVIHCCLRRVEFFRAAANGAGQCGRNPKPDGRMRVSRGQGFIHFSSVHALSQTPFDAPLTEENALALSSDAHPYDRTKAEAEGIVLSGSASGMTCAIVSPTAVLGPNDFKPSRLGRVLWSLFTGKMPALVQSGFDFVDVRDVAQG